VPQNSDLGSILFLIYINDLSTLKISGRFTLFADDAIELWHIPNKSLLNKLVSDDLASIKRWCAANWLSMNMSTTGVMSFGCTLGSVLVGEDVVDGLNKGRFLGL